MRCYRCGLFLDQSPQGSQHGLHAACFNTWFGLAQDQDFRSVIPKSGASNEPHGQTFSNFNSSFFHGKFKKYSAELGNESYILKVQEKKYPELPATEYLCNQIAEHVGLSVPDFYFLNFSGVPTFVTKNFVNKRKQENLVHIYRYLGDQEFGCRALCDIIEAETGRLREIERFVELCLFDALTGNHDRHGRNIGILESKGGKVLSPFYDNPSYIGIEEDFLLVADLNPRGKISTTRTDEPSLKDYVHEFAEFGFERPIRRFSDGVRLPQIEKFLENSFLSPRRREALTKLIRKRAEELENAVKEIS